MKKAKTMKAGGVGSSGVGSPGVGSPGVAEGAADNEAYTIDMDSHFKNWAEREV